MAEQPDDRDAQLERALRAADKIEIIERLSLYQQLLDSRDLDRMDEVLDVDAVVDYPGMEDNFDLGDDTIVGREAIVAWLRSSLVTARTVHYMTNHVFSRCDGSRADVRTYLLSFVYSSDGTVSSPHTTGIYDVELVRRAEGWRVVRLRLEHLYLPETVAFIRGLHGSG